MTGHRGNESFVAIEGIIASDPGRRRIGPLVRAGDLEAAANRLIAARSVTIATGFFIPSAGACETDGPPGAAAMSEALRELGVSVRFLTDLRCAPVLARGGLDPLDIFESGRAELNPPDVLVAIERPGRAADGCVYNSRGIDISEFVEPIDELFREQTKLGKATIGIGDGGNEIGMGKVAGLVGEYVPRGDTIACAVATESLIVAGVSNWGAWGLIAALSIRVGQCLLPASEPARAQLDRLVAAGAVDGLTGECTPTVDGMSWHVHADILEQLREVVTLRG